MKTIIVSISMLAMTFGLMAGEAHSHDAVKTKSACCDKAKTAAKASTCDKAQTAAKAGTCDKAQTAAKAGTCDKAQTAAKADCAGKSDCGAKATQAKRVSTQNTKGGQLLISSL